MENPSESQLKMVRETSAAAIQPLPLELFGCNYHCWPGSDDELKSPPE